MRLHNHVFTYAFQSLKPYNMVFFKCIKLLLHDFELQELKQLDVLVRGVDHVSEPYIGQNEELLLPRAPPSSALFHHEPVFLREDEVSIIDAHEHLIPDFRLLLAIVFVK